MFKHDTTMFEIYVDETYDPAEYATRCIGYACPNCAKSVKRDYKMELSSTRSTYTCVLCGRWVDGILDDHLNSESFTKAYYELCDKYGKPCTGKARIPSKQLVLVRPEDLKFLRIRLFYDDIEQGVELERYGQFLFWLPNCPKIIREEFMNMTLADLPGPWVIKREEDEPEEYYL